MGLLSLIIFTISSNLFSETNQMESRFEFLRDCEDCTLSFGFLNNSTEALKNFSKGEQTYLLSADAIVRDSINTFASDLKKGLTPIQGYPIELSTDAIISCLLRNPAARNANDLFWADNFVTNRKVEFRDLISQPVELKKGIVIGGFVFSEFVFTPREVRVTSVNKKPGEGFYQANSGYISSSIATSDGAFFVGTTIYSRQFVKLIDEVCS